MIAKIEKVVAAGTSIVCATCRHFWEARDKSRPNCGEKCGGPIAGKDFPQYKGPLNGDRLRDWCFVCGQDSGYGLKIPESSRIIGVCEAHLEYLVRLRPSKDTRSRGSLFATDGDTTIQVHRLIRSPKKTLIEEIYEVEKYFAEKEGRTF